MENEKQIEALDSDLVEVFEDISYSLDGHYCIDFSEIEPTFEEKEIENDSTSELLARYLQSKGFGNIARVKERIRVQIEKQSIKQGLDSNLYFIEDPDNYYAMFGRILNSFAIARLENTLLFNFGHITDEESRQNIARINNAKRLAVTIHGKWVIERLEESKTKHTVRTLVSSIYSDIFGIELPKVEE